MPYQVRNGAGVGGWRVTAGKKLNKKALVNSSQHSQCPPRVDGQ